MKRHDLVIIGAGNAGISLAARARRLGCRDVVVIAPGTPHRYRPLLNYVAVGQATMSRLTKPTESVMPQGCEFTRGTVVDVDPVDKYVVLESGETIGYHDLVIASGLNEDLPSVPGLAEALTAGWSTTAHLTDNAEQTWSAIQRIRRGRVVFTIPPEPSPCGGTALKPLFMAADHWRRHGVLPQIEIHLVTPYRDVLDIPFVEERLAGELARLTVTVHHQSTVSSMDHAERTVHVTGPTGTEPLTCIEHAFVVPPYRAPDWLKPLAGASPHGLVDIDPTTLAHRTYPGVWSLGDVADVRTRPSGGALRPQVEVLADNISRARTGRALRTYDGYTIIPITTDRRRLMLVEFDRDLAPQPTVPWPDLTRPRISLWFFDRYLEPVIYFRALLAGRV